MNRLKPIPLRERVAAIAPLALHQAICDAAIAALRDGAPLEKLDGMEYYSLENMQFGARNVTEQRRTHLMESIKAERRVLKVSRRNANDTTSEEARLDFLEDVNAAYRNVEKLSAELAALDDEHDISELPSSVVSQLDYLAYTLGTLAQCTSSPDEDFANVVRQIIRFDRLTAHETERTVEVVFRLVIPADGQVLIFGPITTVVENRAYRSSLPVEMQPTGRKYQARQSVFELVPKKFNRYQAMLFFRDSLREAGYGANAATLLSLSNNAALYNVTANELWGVDLDDDVSAEFAEHVRATYRQEPLLWDRRRYILTAAIHQQCIDIIRDAGGTITQGAFRAAAAELGYSEFQVGKLHLVRSGHGLIPLAPAFERVGHTREGPKGNNNLLQLISCPHCEGFLTKVVRVREVPTMLLCPDCRRMPTEPSIVFPRIYLTL